MSTWNECPEWCFQDECEEGWHHCYQEFWYQGSSIYVRLNRNFNTGEVEVDLGKDAHDYDHSLKTREELHDVLSHIKELTAFLSTLEKELKRTLSVS